MSKTIVRNVFANWAGMAIGLAIAFLMSPFLVHSLGDTMYGLWVMLLAVTGYMGLLEAGLKVSVVKYISRFNAQADTTSMSRVVSTVLLLHGTVGVVILSIAVLLGPFLPRLFAIPPEIAPVAQTVLLITALNLVITLLASVFNGVLAGLQRYDYANAIGVTVSVVRSALIVLFISRGYGIIALGLIHTFGQVCASLLITRAAFRAAGGLRLQWSLIDRATIKMLYSYGGFVVLNAVAMFFLFNSAEIIIGAFMTAAAITHYAIASSLLNQLSQLIGVMTQVLHPYASALDAKEDKSGLRRTAVLGTKACLVIALPAAVTFMLLGKDFIGFWMGPAYGEAVAPLIVVLAIGRLSWQSQSSAGNVLMGAGRHKVLTLTTLATGAAGIALGTLLIRPFGLFGLALGMTIPLVIGPGLMLPLATVKAFSIPKMEYFREAYLQPAMATAPYFVVLATLEAFIRPRNLLELALVVVGALPVLAAGTYFFCLSRSQRRMVGDTLLRRLPAPAPERL